MNLGDIAHLSAHLKLLVCTAAECNISHNLHFFILYFLARTLLSSSLRVQLKAFTILLDSWLRLSQKHKQQTAVYLFCSHVCQCSWVPSILDDANIPSCPCLGWWSGSTKPSSTGGNSLGAVVNAEPLAVFCHHVCNRIWWSPDIIVCTPTPQPLSTIDLILLRTMFRWRQVMSVFFLCTKSYLAR